MEYPQALAYIGSFSRLGRKVRDLSRMRRLLELLGNPQEGLQYVHIAGTNGKGSTVTMCASALAEAGYQVGKFTSPYIENFRERIQVGGVSITEGQLCELVEWVRPACDELRARGEVLSQFEVTTAIAFEHFQRRHCDIVCLEVGIGGALDCTNVIGPPLVAVITTIALDHQSILGASIEEITRQKAGIIKGGCPVVCAPNQLPCVMATLMEVCAERGSTLILPNENAVELVTSGILGTVFTYSNAAYQLAMGGAHQVTNALTAIEALGVLAHKGFAFSTGTLAAGLAKAVIPARAEVVGDRPLTILDGAHNPSGMHAIASLMQSVMERPRIGVLGMLSDKNAEGALGELLAELDAVVCVGDYSPRALSAEAVADLVLASPQRKPVLLAVDVHDALRMAKRHSGKGGAILIAGSLYLCAEARPLLVRGKIRHRR